jgi:hypothetical protein
MKKRPVFDEDKLGSNNFLTNLRIPVNINYIEKRDGSTLEEERERNAFCKVFVSGEKRKRMNELSSTAKELLMWIIYELDPAKDYFWLNRERYMAEMNIKSKTTVTNAVSELLTTYIQPTRVREIYFINPDYMFNGSRINKFPNNLTNPNREDKMKWK